MKCICQKTLLSEAVQNVSRVIAAKSGGIPALEGVQIKAYQRALTLTGYDMEAGITTTITASVEEEGEIVLPARLFSEMIRKMDGEEIAISVGEQYRTDVVCGRAQYSIIGIASEEFPELPLVSEGTPIQLPHATLKSMIEQTLFAVAQTDTKPVHTGSLFDIREDAMSIVSVDGYRLALRNAAVDCAQSISFVVPGKVLGEIVKLLGDGAEEPVSILVSERHIMFKIGSYSVISRLLDGEFLDYKSSIPVGSRTVVGISTRELIESVERVSLLISDRLRSPLRILFEENIIKISCSTPLGKSYDELPCMLDGETVEMGFNNKYILDALKAADTDQVRIEINGPLSPVKILPSRGEDFLFLVLPVRLKNDL